MPSPHIRWQDDGEPVQAQYCCIWQELVQPSLSNKFPSSQVSEPHILESPQIRLHTVPLQVYPISMIHPYVHPSPFIVFPSSHCSLPAFFESPQVVWHTEGDPAHEYPYSTKQLLEHPSLFA